MQRRDLTRRLWQYLLPRGFNQQVAALSALSLMVALAVFGYVIYQKQTTLQEESALAKANIIIRNFASASYRDILLANYDEIRELLLHTAEFPEVRRILVTDNQGRIISDVVHKPGGAPQEVFGPKEMQPPHNDEPVMHRTGDQYELWQAVADHAREVAGAEATVDRD